MTVKRINFTNRKRLTREHANIVIHPPINGQGCATFDAQLDLNHLRPQADTARVFVEAYHQTTRMRFDFGTVGAITHPARAECRLHEFHDWKDVLFRVKITDVQDHPGQLLGWGNQIRPKGPDDMDEPDLVRFKDADLYGLLWDIEYDDHGPVVLIELNAGGVQHVGRDDRFRAAVFPEVLRRTLVKALVEDEIAHDDVDHWFALWFEGFLKPKLGLPAPPPAEDITRRRDWIDNAVKAFARHFRIAEFWSADAPRPAGEEA
ncbi:MAG: hypothetical protein R3C45_03880 [Phycisphaerales bacterium]